MLHERPRDALDSVFHVRAFHKAAYRKNPENANTRLPASVTNRVMITDGTENYPSAKRFPFKIGTKNYSFKRMVFYI